MSYQQATVALATASEAAVLAAWTAFRLVTDFVAGAALIVARFNVRATSLADLYVAKTVDAQPVGLGRPDDQPRLEASFMSQIEVIEERDDPQDVARAKLARIARSEPLHAGRAATQEAMVTHGVDGWRRQVNGDACELCRWLVKDGKVFPADARFHVHSNCSCTMVPVGGRGRGWHT